MTTFYTHVPSPIGPLLLAGDGQSITHLRFTSGPKKGEPDPGWVGDASPFREAARQLKNYFAGSLRDFDLPLALNGTAFQVQVWQALQEIPYGQTISYGELARRVGNPSASRAVGLANGANRIAIIIPCHRVIGSNGKLTGFGGGLDIKERLLALEQGTPSLF